MANNKDIIQMIRTAAETIDADYGLKTIAALPEQIKTALIYDLLFGPRAVRLGFQLVNHVQSSKIHAIKEMRILTGLGLKEAKDLVEDAERGQQVLSFNPDSMTPQRVEDIKRNFRTWGYNVEVLA